MPVKPSFTTPFQMMIMLVLMLTVYASNIKEELLPQNLISKIHQEIEVSIDITKLGNEKDSVATIHEELEELQQTIYIVPNNPDWLNGVFGHPDLSEIIIAFVFPRRITNNNRSSVIASAYNKNEGILAQYVIYNYIHLTNNREYDFFDLFQYLGTIPSTDWIEFFTTDFRKLLQKAEKSFVNPADHERDLHSMMYLQKFKFYRPLMSTKFPEFPAWSPQLEKELDKVFDHHIDASKVCCYSDIDDIIYVVEDKTDPTNIRLFMPFHKRCQCSCSGIPSNYVIKESMISKWRRSNFSQVCWKHAMITLIGTVAAIIGFLIYYTVAISLVVAEMSILIVLMIAEIVLRLIITLGILVVQTIVFVVLSILGGETNDYRSMIRYIVPACTVQLLICLWGLMKCQLCLPIS